MNARKNVKWAEILNNKSAYNSGAEAEVSAGGSTLERSVTSPSSTQIHTNTHITLLT